MGWFPCTFKRANFVVLTIALGLCASNVRATKIEFSVATSEVEVPDQQKELKKEAKASPKSDINFKGGINIAPTASRVVVNPVPDRDPFASNNQEKSRNGRPNEPANDKSGNTALADKYRAAQAAEAMRTSAQDSLSSSAWEVNRRSTFSRETSRETDSTYNPRERSVGWSTLFKEAQEERDRKEQTARLNDFKALYETHNSMMPIGTPAANSDPMKESLWRDQAMNQRGENREQLYSRHDEGTYGQPAMGLRGNTELDMFNSGPAKSDFRNSDIAPVRDFQQHRGVLEFPKRPGDLLK